MADQEKVLSAAGARVYKSSDDAVRYAGKLLRLLGKDTLSGDEMNYQEVDLDGLSGEFAAINVGLESFSESLEVQDARVIQVDWKPAAGGNQDLMALLEKMKG